MHYKLKTSKCILYHRGYVFIQIDHVFLFIPKYYKLTFSCLSELLISKETKGNAIFNVCVIVRPFPPIKQLITAIIIVKDTTLRCLIHI